MSESGSSALWFSILMSSLEAAEFQDRHFLEDAEAVQAAFHPHSGAVMSLLIGLAFRCPVVMTTEIFVYVQKEEVKAGLKGCGSHRRSEPDWSRPRLTLTPQCNKPRKRRNVIKVLANVAARSGISDAADVCSYFSVTSWGCPWCFLLLPLQLPFQKARRWVESLKKSIGLC